MKIPAKPKGTICCVICNNTCSVDKKICFKDVGKVRQYTDSFIM